jgi:peptide methionine sulfoxide reductase msrA/msrB
LTAKNTRHCVNSISLTFDKEKKDTLSYAYFAGGCFWGVEYYLEKLDGVKSVTSGFMGGKVENPSYREVVAGDSGHLETVEVLYDASKISYEQLAKVFFEIHDPTQVDGQGPDIGAQYLSAIFVDSEEERETIERLINILKAKNYKIATKILKKSPFYKAEEYHQDYYERHKKEPYCHARVKRF